jgi:hypothetical protein
MIVQLDNHLQSRTPTSGVTDAVPEPADRWAEVR